MTDKKLTLSIVIPVYNEEGYLKACLESIKNQSVKPDEVIVVDNNSNDKTVQIARGYKFVTVLYEKRQHQSFAQKTGFDNARGLILARIDADTVLPGDWCSNVLEYFRLHRSTIGITGSTIPYDMNFKRLFKFGFDAYYRLSSFWAGHRLLWGANMAIRKKAWQKVSSQVLLRPDIWEDYDLSFCLAKYGKLKLLKNINVLSSFRAIQRQPWTQIRYQFRAVRTFSIRRGKPIALLFLITWLVTSITFPVMILDRYFVRFFKLKILR